MSELNSQGGTLEAHGLAVRYGVIDAVRDVSFSLDQGQAVALIGNNGAGKSTTLLSIAGGLPLEAVGAGTVRQHGVSFSKNSVAERRGAGITIVPERSKVFSLLTVEENILASGDPHARGGIGAADVYGWFPRLAERRRTLAGNLSGGEQQMLAIGMALLGEPKVLLIDEPTLGLSVPIIEKMCETLAMLRKSLNLSLLVAEAEVRWLPHLAEAAVVMDRGMVIGRVAGDLAGHKDWIQNLLLGQAPASQLAGESA